MFLQDLWQETWDVCNGIFLMLIPLYCMLLHVATSVQQRFFRGTRHARTARPRVVPRFRRRRLRKVASATCLGSIGREILLSYDAVPSAEWCCHWQAQFIIENTGKITVLPWVCFNFPLVLDTATARVCASLAKGFARKNVGPPFARPHSFQFQS